MPDNIQINLPDTLGKIVSTTEAVDGSQHENVIAEYVNGGGQPVKVSATTPLPVLDSASVALLTTIAALLAAQSFIEVAATFAAIIPSTTKRLVYVQADETNNGDISLYIYNGTALKFLQTVAP